jgi:hypothetical protein
LRSASLEKIIEGWSILMSLLEPAITKKKLKKSVKSKDLATQQPFIDMPDILPCEAKVHSQ